MATAWLASMSILNLDRSRGAWPESKTGLDRFHLLERFQVCVPQFKLDGL